MDIRIIISVHFRYNFNKVAQYKQLTLEEAEEKMKNRRKTADGYQRWMMKAANNGAAAFGEVEKSDDRESAAGGGRGRKKATGDDDEGNASDNGDEDEEEEAARKSRLGLNKKGGDDDEEGLRGGDLDFDDDDIEKGDNSSSLYMDFTMTVNHYVGVLSRTSCSLCCKRIIFSIDSVEYAFCFAELTFSRILSLPLF